MPVQPAERRASSRPAAQIAPKSSLGAVLSEVALRYQTHSPVRRHENPDDEDPSSPSSSESRDSDESYPSSSERDRRRRRKQKDKRKKSARKKSYHDDGAIKPIPLVEALVKKPVCCFLPVIKTAPDVVMDSFFVFCQDKTLGACVRRGHLVFISSAINNLVACPDWNSTMRYISPTSHSSHS